MEKNGLIILSSLENGEPRRTLLKNSLNPEDLDELSVKRSTSA